MLLATALAPCLLQDVLNRRLLFKTNRHAVAPKGNHITIISSFLELQKKTVDVAKICGGAENVVKIENPNIRKWIARFYYFSIYTPLEACVCIAHNCMSCPSIWATLSALLINILLGSFQLFFAAISLSLRVK